MNTVRQQNIKNPAIEHDMTGSEKVILIVEDQDDIRQLIKMSLAFTKHKIYEASNCQSALTMALTLKPDLMLLDVMLPTGVDAEPPELNSGLKLCCTLKNSLEFASIPIILLTSKGQAIDIQAGFAAGADEYIVKPFSVMHLIEVVRRQLSTTSHGPIKNEPDTFTNPAITTHSYTHQGGRSQLSLDITQPLDSEDSALDDILSPSQDAHHEVLMRLAIASRYSDDATKQHTIRIGYMAEKLSSLLGESDEFCYMIRLAAPMHDIGNIGIPEAILKKPSTLSLNERAIMNTHTKIGFNILVQADAPLFQLAASIALTHHEKFDGTGYPNQLAGHAIPLAGRIVALVDYFDALTMNKPYRAAFSDVQAIEMVLAQNGKLFDPDMVEVFIANIACFKQLRLSINASPVKYDQLLNYSHATFITAALQK